MRIAIDGNEANVAQRVGSNAYAYELLCSLEELSWDNPEIEWTVLLAAPPQKDFPKERVGWKYLVIGPAPFWTQFALPVHLFVNQAKYDVFYTPGHYGPRVSVIPYVSSVMDLAFLYFPRQFKQKDYLQLKEWTRYSVKHASKVIAISEYSKQDVIREYKLKPNKVVVAYPGFVKPHYTSFKEKEKTEVLKKWGIKPPFILYVGTLQPRKNLVRLVEAFELLQPQLKDSPKLQLVIAGKTGWLAKDILKKVASSPLQKQIILTGYVSEQEKIILFKESICTVLVGLYEGFGIPALEALAYGSIPVVSKTTSLPEVVDGAGILVDPLETTEIMKGLQRAVKLSAKDRTKLLRKGQAQLKKFTWRKSAEVVLATLQSLVQQ